MTAGTQPSATFPSCTGFTAVPGAQLRMLPGLGHIPMSDDPPAVANAIFSFTVARPAATVEPGPRSLPH